MNLFKNKKILITGGYGFIGSHLTKRLLQNESNISIITIPDTNTFRLQDELAEIATYETDICDAAAINSVVKEIHPDYVFHLASYGVNSAHADYEKAVRTNVLGSVNIINAVIGSGCQKFINMGTCSEYGNRETDEDTIPVPINIYGSTKAATTLILHQIAKENDLPIVTMRPFGVFGEGEEPHKIFSYVILNLLRGKNMPLTPCEQSRDYCHVENIIDALLLTCEKTNITNEIFNVASGESHPLRYYIDLIYKISGTDKKPIYGEMPYRKNELWDPRADTDKIKAMLGWKIKIPLEEGIARTIEWYQQNRNQFEI